MTSTAEYRESLRRSNYVVADLTGDDAQAAADLAALLQRLVVPESWQGNGGRGTWKSCPTACGSCKPGTSITRSLFSARSSALPAACRPRAVWMPKKFVLTSRTAGAKDILDRVASVNVSVPSSLSSILDRFKQPAGSEIVIDRPALAAAGIAENTAGKFNADKLPQGEALGKLLEPLGLAWRAVDANTLQVSTQKAVDARMELEFYPLGKLPAGQTPTALIERIKAGLHGAAWGEGGAGGAIYFDLPSQCLIVLQSQPVQRAIEGTLAEKAK